MANPPHPNYPVSADRLKFHDWSTYHGGILVATAGGTATVNVYDGVDANGDLIDAFAVAVSSIERHWMDDGIQLKRGLYIDLGANVSAFTMFAHPPPRELG